VIKGTQGHLDRGQATVELALLLPIVALIVWSMLEGILVARDQLLLSHAAREAARNYAVHQSIVDATKAAIERSGLGADVHVVVTTDANGIARVRASLNESERLPLLGSFVSNIELSSELSIVIEADPG
jgi:Flp pilus assembly protein TadG